jgi:hypothetical protein
MIASTSPRSAAAKYSEMIVGIDIVIVVPFRPLRVSDEFCV